VLVIMSRSSRCAPFAEEKRAGTYELLLTSPLSVAEIVLGKLLGLLGFVAIMVGLTGIYPLILLFYGNPEAGPILAGYLGLFSARRGLRLRRTLDFRADRQPDRRRGRLLRRAAAPLCRLVAGGNRRRRHQRAAQIFVRSSTTSARW
jgi:hypothetical protein